ncbi:hypothetical protein M5689_011672 [Euphorbia peplus]|nr:hypothetical protein M5689_011672 [Euphorbia peplus]
MDDGLNQVVRYVSRRRGNTTPEPASIDLSTAEIDTTDPAANLQALPSSSGTAVERGEELHEIEDVNPHVSVPRPSRQRKPNVIPQMNPRNTRSRATGKVVAPKQSSGTPKLSKFKGASRQKVVFEANDSGSEATLGDADTGSTSEDEIELVDKKKKKKRARLEHGQSKFDSPYVSALTFSDDEHKHRPLSSKRS